MLGNASERLILVALKLSGRPLESQTLQSIETERASPQLGQSGYGHAPTISERNNPTLLNDR